MGSYIKATFKSCFYHIRSFRQIRSSTDYVHFCCFCFGLVTSGLLTYEWISRYSWIIRQLRLKKRCATPHVKHYLQNIICHL